MYDKKGTEAQKETQVYLHLRLEPNTNTLNLTISNSLSLPIRPYTSFSSSNVSKSAPVFVYQLNCFEHASTADKRLPL